MEDREKIMQTDDDSGIFVDDMTMPGKRDRKPDGRFEVGELIINRYKVLAELGQGGMGMVYRCFDEVAGVEVALKALPPELSHNTLEMEDIKENFQLVSKLVHQNIAISKNLEKDKCNGNYYLIMEYVEGEDLKHWLRRKNKENRVSLEEVLSIVWQIACALDYAHEMKVMHRDIKPGNIMIDNTGRIKILDFGLAAQIHTSMTRVSMAYHGTSGTGPYMAPEQWRGKAQGAASDQYALGVMVYEMLAGHLPFESADAAVLKHAVLDETPDNIVNIPKYVQDAIKRAMSKNADERFDSCSDFAAVLSGEKVKILKKRIKFNSFLKWSAILLFTAVVGAIAYLSGGVYAENKVPEKMAVEFSSPAEKEPKPPIDDNKKNTDIDDAVKIDAVLKEEKIVPQEDIPQETQTAVVPQVVSEDVAPKKNEVLKSAPDNIVVEKEQPKPSLEIIAKVNDQPVPAKVRFNNSVYNTDKIIDDLSLNSEYKGYLSYKDKGKEYVGDVVFRCDWTGRKTITVQLEEWSFDNIRLSDKITLKMVKIKAGSFMMGSPDGEVGRDKDEKLHKVTLTEDYWIGVFEVTQKQYEAVMNKNPSILKGADNPVDNVTLDMAKEFCKNLNERYSGKLPEGYAFDLPTEAQWEYACRAESARALNNGNNLSSTTGDCKNLDKVGWYHKNSYIGGRGHKKVGQKQPNKWGLYDMHGNVQEWCRSRYEKYNNDVIDPVGGKRGFFVVRGGSWNHDAKYCRSAERVRYKSAADGNTLGFRLALVPVK